MYLFFKTGNRCVLIKKSQKKRTRMFCIWKSRNLLCEFNKAKTFNIRLFIFNNSLNIKYEFRFPSCPIMLILKNLQLQLQKKAFSHTLSYFNYMC